MKHLSKKELAELSRLLDEDRQRLRRDIRNELLRNNEESYGELAGTTHDSGDESVADLLSEMNTALLGESIRNLREVEAAQERISTGEYALCEDCGEEIPFSRLKAYPSARRCVNDQGRYEKLHKRGG